jgi:hypothetical protein
LHPARTAKTQVLFLCHSSNFIVKTCFALSQVLIINGNDICQCRPEQY